jgi:hypothetical protein
MLKGIVILTMAFILIGCCNLRKFDESTGTFKNDTERVPCWKVAEREAGIIKSLRTHGKVVVEEVKEPNKWLNIICGIGMAIGGSLMIGGIVWTGYNLFYLGGKYIKSGILAVVSGVTILGCSYFLMEYTWVIVCLVSVAVVGGIVWLVWYMMDDHDRDLAAVNTVRIAMDGGDDENTQDRMRNAQGKHQQFFKKLKNEILVND